MACGTPVIAYGRGSMGELIEHGRSGMIVQGVDAAARAVDQIGALDRAAIRASTSERFGLATMVQAYAALYRRILRPDAVA